MMNSSYDVNNDEYFKNYIRSNRVTDATAIRYASEVNKLCKANDMEFVDFVDKCKYEQSYVKEIPVNTNNDDGVKEYLKVDFDVNNPNSFIKKGLNAYVDYCIERGNHNSNINNSMSTIRSILAFCDIKLPKWVPLDDDAEPWYLLEKEDFIFILNDCSLNHKALITFMLSSGIRLGDCLNWTIEDFMKNTSEYHDFNDVEEFIDNAPQDMIGYWHFKPQKTKRYKYVDCKTFNSPESSNYILQNLRRVKNEYLPRKSREMGKELKISKTDYLFGSRHKLYTGKISVKGISEQFRLKNKKLHEWRVNKIKLAIKNGELSEEDFDKEVAKIPKFHAHACRKYFISTVSNNCGNLRICALLEGHRYPMKNDPNYVEKEGQTVKGAYLQALDDLTLAKVKTKILTNKMTEEIQKELAEKDDMISNLKETVNELKKDKKIMEDSEIENIINWFYTINLQEDELRTDEENVKCLYAIEIAKEDAGNFEVSEEYMESLFKKADARYLMNLQDYDDKVKESRESLSPAELTQNLVFVVNKVMIRIFNNEQLWAMVSDKEKMLKFKVIEYLDKYDCRTLDDLTEDIIKIVSEKAVADVL